MIGKTLGHYQITNQLGKGGMGEVFQAKDQVLGREVAIKVLPEEFARDTDRVARFQREAKVLASLNHPNIAAIHGLEESGGTNFLVLELVEGETLADRLKHGPIPVEESLKLALQVAEAIEAAHEKGVIHRDLKPSNIKVTLNGKVKVLDFGLAKAYAGDKEEVNLSNSPTLSDAATQQGVILGTAAYMSPEQARGKSVDKRADIWAFGCVLFEMLTGRATFSGRDVTDILAAVIRSEPEWNSLPTNLHWRLREVLERCLKKDAKDRYHDISDVKADIQKVLADPSGFFMKPVTAIEPRKRLRAILYWIATIMLTAIVAIAIVLNVRKPEPRKVIRLDFELPSDQKFSNFENPLLAISPDGSQFVYSTTKGLYLRSINELASKLVAGTDENLTDPFFSPDGQWIGYWAPGSKQLKKISINGGAPVLITNSEKPGYPIWNADDRILYAQHGLGFFLVSANGGTPELLTETKGELIACPRILPDKKALIFTGISGGRGTQLFLQLLKSKERKSLFPGDTAQYLPTGHLLYTLGNNLMAVPFDRDKGRAIGGPVPVVEDVYRSAALMAPQYAVSDSGTLVYVPGKTPAAATPMGRTLVWVDRNGKEEQIPAEPQGYRSPKISPDGKKVALTASIGGNADIWIWDFARRTLTRLTFHEAADGYPLWSPDGKRITFLSGRDNSYWAYWKPADGTGKDELLVSLKGRVLIPSCWSGDGKIMVLMETTPTPTLPFDIAMTTIEGNRETKLLLQEKYNELQPQISPNGKWMAYMSDESGQPQVYVRPFPQVNEGRWQVSAGGGDSPLWAPDGRELFYRNGDAILAVPVQTDQTFSPGTPKILFRGRYLTISTQLTNLELRPWDISPDGKRFLMVKPAGLTGGPSSGEGPRKINIVLNWFEELKQRVPVK